MNNCVKDIESKYRSLVKSIIFISLCILLEIFTISIIFGQPLLVSGTIIIIEIIELIGYYTYERIWGKIKWGIKVR